MADMGISDVLIAIFAIDWNWDLNSHTRTFIKLGTAFLTLNAANPKPQSPTKDRAEMADMGVSDVLIATFAIDWNRDLNSHMRTFINSVPDWVRIPDFGPDSGPF